MTHRIAVKSLLPHWATAWLILVLLISSIPYLIGLFVAAQINVPFTGVVISETDTFSYFADMQLGVQGKWLYRLPYSAIESKPVPLFFVYILLGHVSRILSLPVPLVYHLSRLLFGAVFFFLSFLFIARYLVKEPERKLAFALLLFTGGWGWIPLIIKGPGIPMGWIPDIWIFDGVSFGSLLGFPHFLLSMALMLLVFLAGEKFVNQGNWKAGLTATFAGIGVAFIHAHQLAILVTVLGLYALFVGWGDRLRLRQAILRSAGITLPGFFTAIFLTLVSRSDPLLSSWLSQGDTYSPPLPALLILYGPGAILAFWGLFHAIREKEKDFILPALWFSVVLAFLYIPVNFQRRFIEGWHVPVVLLAVLGWRRLTSSASSYNRKAKWLTVGLVSSMVLSQVFLLTVAVASALSPEKNVSFLPEDERRAAQYLHFYADPADVVLTSFTVGNHLPALTGIRSFIGHWSLTPDVYSRMEDARRFYNENSSDAVRKSILTAFGVDYVYFGPEERELGGFTPEKADYLVPVFTSETVQLYQVKLIP